MGVHPSHTTKQWCEWCEGGGGGGLVPLTPQWQPGATEAAAKVMMTGANGTFVYYYYLSLMLFSFSMPLL